MEEINENTSDQNRLRSHGTGETICVRISDRSKIVLSDRFRGIRERRTEGVIYRK